MAGFAVFTNGRFWVFTEVLPAFVSFSSIHTNPRKQSEAQNCCICATLFHLWISIPRFVCRG
jgi:hypothetical protein